MYSQTVIPAKAGIQGLGMSLDKLRACPGLDTGVRVKDYTFIARCA